MNAEPTTVLPGIRSPAPIAVRLLLVEDNAGDVRLVREMLRGARGMDLEAVGSLADAVARLADDGIDVVLLDLGLPDSRGLETLTSLIRSYPAMPIVALTGLDDDTLALAAVQAGAQDYLSKNTVTPEILRRTLRHAIERHRAEDDLRRSRDELEQRVRERTEELNLAKLAAETASRAKSDFLSNMSHELRTPLGAIIGFSELLDEKLFGDLNPKQEEYVKDIVGSGRHLLSLINDILDLSKIEAGKMELEPSLFPIARLLEDSLVMVKEKCMKHGTRLTTDIEDPVKSLLILADERKLKQIMFNLLSNAAKFTPGGGQITVSARRNAGAESVGVWECGGMGMEKSPQTQAPTLLISVSDTGIGIAKENQARMFETFYQVASSARGKPAGTGLGLSLVKRMVEQHGGRVWLESEGEGKGTTFRFSLPIDAGEAGGGST